jgi:hypothetical protein
VNGRRRGEWLPDGLHYLDVRFDPALLMRAVEHRMDTGDLEGRAVEHIAVPKGLTAFRPGALLRLDDEVLYTLLVLRCGSVVENALDDGVFSYRLAHENDDDLLTPQGKAWGKFQRVQSEAPKGPWTHALVTDIAGFYEYIDEAVLAETLTDLGAPADAISSLRGLIKGWQKKTGLKGLPQGPDASAVLANAFLIPVDEQMLAESAKHGWRYIRWSDDIRVLTKSEDEARTAAYLLSVAMRRRGLYLAPGKTEFLAIAELAERATDEDLERIAYLFDAKMFDQVRVKVGPVFRRATKNYTMLSVDKVTELRFCLYRMGRTADDRALRLLLQHLPAVGFLEGYLYLYLREFIDRRTVISRVTDVLDGLDPFRDALLAGNLLRVIAEAKSVDVRTLNVVRRFAWGVTGPDAVRAVAIRALGVHATATDEADLKTHLWRESDHRVIRSTLTAVKDANPVKANVTLGDYRRANPEYGVVVDYLKRFGAPSPRR